MSLLKVFDIAGSGMSAQTVRLNTTASNLANVDSVSSSENDTYKARMPVFASTMQNVRQEMFPEFQDSVGVSVKGVVESNVPLRSEYHPEHPQANAEGYIFKTNVNPMEEMANMISSSRTFQANVELLQTAKNLAMRTLNLGQG